MAEAEQIQAALKRVSNAANPGIDHASAAACAVDHVPGRVMHGRWVQCRVVRMGMNESGKVW